MTAARSTVSPPRRTTRPAAARAALAADPAGARPEIPRTEIPRTETSRPDSPRTKTPHRLRRIAEKRTAILDAGLALFSRYGLHGTTVEQIARTAAVSKTNLFYYFASKEEVYVGVLSRLLDQWLDPLRALEVETDPVEGIRAYISRKIRFSRTHPEASRLFCLEVVQGAPLLRGELETALKQLVDAKTEVIAGWVAAGKLAPIDPHHLIFALWATTQHYADFAVQIDALLGRGLDEEAFVEEATRNVQRLILDGLRPR
ncbi:HTH-type transcriptional regulator RutR [Ancylobacter vacuolatus]|uniref:TetR/AcrR family transcriptional regulator n=1 Tax=Ancylobacter vacuolatus TaxID=223389 RepID=A0ABU0DED6_9HYPH|nr:HTH-type transcriptional regulator RutR [Ancylobacter vacuolatus]MDQ0346771.1 TetR/AcrR family transcriptional regulator [Ancylobacter vacuolatus]